MKRPRLLWIAILAGWILIGIPWTLNYYFFAEHYVSIFKEPPTLGQMLVWELPYWLLWAGLSPLIFYLARRFRIERDTWLRNLLVHVMSCFLLSIGHRAVYLSVGWFLHVAAYQKLSSLTEVYRLNFFFNLPPGFMSYATILLVGQAIDYYHRYQDEELKASRLETRLAQAELKATQSQLDALKMQMHPHFLFNTLNSVSALLEENADAADRMLTRLGDFLRLTLQNSGAHEVTLEEELEFLRCYLDIERVRFEDRLTVNFTIDPQALEIPVPNLILQPIVENAIKHGIARRAGPGRIDIRARVHDRALKLEIEDDGYGIPGGNPRDAGAREGLGLANTKARLEQLYGGAHKLDLTASPGGGLQVTLEIPFPNESVTTAAREPDSRI